MKKAILSCLCMVIIISIVFAFMMLTGKSNSERRYSEDIAAILSKHEEEYGHEFMLATKKIENTIYGEWAVGDESVGISLKYGPSIGLMDYEGRLNISKDSLVEITRSERAFIIVGEEVRYTGDRNDFTEQYKTPVFAYYTETLGEMAADDMLSWYSGIEGMDPNTVGTVVISMGVHIERELPQPKDEKYRFLSPTFILIDDYVIAVYDSSFYKLERLPTGSL